MPLIPQLGRSVKLTVTSARLATADEVRRRLQQIEGCGWLQTTSAVYVRKQGENWRHVSGVQSPNGPWDQVPLDAELADTHAVSWTLRHEGRTWTWAELQESPGDDHQVRDETLVSNWRPAGNDKPDVELKYRVYWAPQTEGPPDDTIEVLRPSVARFCGFVLP